MKNSETNDHHEDESLENVKNDTEKKTSEEEIVKPLTTENSSSDSVTSKPESVPTSDPESDQASKLESDQASNPESVQTIDQESVKASDAKSDVADESSAEHTDKSSVKQKNDLNEDQPVSPSPKPKKVSVKPVQEKINFELLSKEDLVQLLEEELNSKPFDKVRDQIDGIRRIFNSKNEEEIKGKKEKFIAEGGIEEDFKPFDDPSVRKMDDLLEKVKSLKTDFNKKLEQSKEQNLADKQEVLEELRLLMDGQESFDNTFRKFKQLQKRWFDSGFVPQQNVKDLWNSYNYFVDKFNDFVRINRELRALDLRKNMEFKIILCEKAEELANEEDVVLAFKTLQKFHAQWRETGPVPREDKDTLWERFKIATAVINKSHQNHQSELRVSLIENLEKKEKLCEKIEEISLLKFESHRDWADRTQEVLSIQKEWKTIGYAPKKDNNLIYARFRKACDLFFESKAGFYAETFEQQKGNLKEKELVVVEAEKLMDSTEWKETTNRLISLQKKWKEIGPVPRRDSDRLWKKFRAACDHFFTQKSAFYSDIDSSYEENLSAKIALVEEMKKYKAPEKQSQLIKDLDDYHKRYSEIGFVPVNKKEEIREIFREALNEILASLEIDEQTKSLISYRSRMLGILRSPKSDTKFNYERDKLHTKVQQLKNDLSVWENNIGFIKQTESSETTISGYQERLDESKLRIQLLEKKILLLDELENEI